MLAVSSHHRDCRVHRPLMSKALTELGLRPEQLLQSANSPLLDAAKSATPVVVSVDVDLNFVMLIRVTGRLTSPRSPITRPAIRQYLEMFGCEPEEAETCTYQDIEIRSPRKLLLNTF